jgi:hypothetical protein
MATLYVFWSFLYIFQKNLATLFAKGAPRARRDASAI